MPVGALIDCSASHATFPFLDSAQGRQGAVSQFKSALHICFKSEFEKLILNRIFDDKENFERIKMSATPRKPTKSDRGQNIQVFVRVRYDFLTF